MQPVSSNLSATNDPDATVTAESLHPIGVAVLALPTRESSQVTMSNRGCYLRTRRWAGLLSLSMGCRDRHSSLRTEMISTPSIHRNPTNAVEIETLRNTAIR